MSLEGVLDAYITANTVDSETFLEFIDTSLIRHILPFNGVNPHSVIVMDNASIHHTDLIADTLQSLGVLVHYLPAYSPDLNPIEEAFSKMKSYIVTFLYIQNVFKEVKY